MSAADNRRARLAGWLRGLADKAPERDDAAYLGGYRFGQSFAAIVAARSPVKRP